MVDYNATAHFWSSVSIIVKFETSELVTSRWKCGSDGCLEIPIPIPEASYLLEVCTSDGKRERIPLVIAACAPNKMQDTIEQS